MCASRETTTSRPFLATQVSTVEASSPSPKCSFIPVVTPTRITPTPKISLAMRPSRTSALPVALTADTLDYFYEPSSHFYDDEGPTNDDHCFMTPKDVAGQRSALDSSPPLRCPSSYISTISSYISTTPPSSLPIPNRLFFPEI